MDYPYNDADRRALRQGRNAGPSAWALVFQELRSRGLSEAIREAWKRSHGGDEAGLMAWVEEQLSGSDPPAPPRQPEQLETLSPGVLERLRAALAGRDEAP